MPGGTWTSQNKRRPGAYFNFESVSRPAITTGDRGVGALALTLPWGPSDRLIDVTGTDLLSGAALAETGLTAFDDDAKLLTAMLSGCQRCLLYRLNGEGEKAKADIPYKFEEVEDRQMTVTAKYSGEMGNTIHIVVEETPDAGFFKLSTYVRGDLNDTQVITRLGDIEDTDFVEFSYSDADGVPVEIAGEPLSGGTNGDATETVGYGKFFGLLETANFNTLAVPTDNAAIKGTAVTFVERMRNDEGRYIQGVVADYTVDYEGIINVANGLVINGEDFSTEEATAVVAGLTAGAAINESNTAKAISGATDVIGDLSNTAVIEALEMGKVVFTKTRAGAVKMEQDINSLHTYPQGKSTEWSKNRPLRVMDEIGTTLKDEWEANYMGKVSNNDSGRDMFKSACIEYLVSLEDIDAIQNFDRTVDVTVSQGSSIDAVLLNINIQPVDSMEKLYGTVRLTVQ